MMPPDQLIGIEPVRELPITAEKLAINAVMAGCLPMHFPGRPHRLAGDAEGRVPAARRHREHRRLRHPGRAERPDPPRVRRDATFNALGNSDRATAVIGRAIRLALINLLDVRPGGIDRSTLGHPGKFSYCIAEDEEDTPWKPLPCSAASPEALRRHRDGGRRRARS